MELHDSEAQVHAPTPKLGPWLQEEERLGGKTQPLHFTPLTSQQILPATAAASQANKSYKSLLICWLSCS